MNQAELEINSVSIGFPNNKGQWTRVVNEVTLSVDVGERVALVGESGSGKSLVAFQAAGVTPPPGRLLGGSVQARTRPGLVMQEAAGAFNPVLTIGFQLREIISSQTNHDSTERVPQLLEKVGLDDISSIMRAYPHQLSGGQAQRAFIALALAGDPKLLVADEPTTGLDHMTQAGILELFIELTRDHNMGLLLISHDLKVTAAITEKLYVMYGGMIVEEGSTTDLLNHPMHPFTRLLANPAKSSNHTSYQASMRPGLQGCRFAHRCSIKNARCEHALPKLVEVSPQRKLRCPIAAESRTKS